MNLWKMRFREQFAVREEFVEADTRLEAEWLAREECTQRGWRYITVGPGVIRSTALTPMPRVEAEKKSARVGA